MYFTCTHSDPSNALQNTVQIFLSALDAGTIYHCKTYHHGWWVVDRPASFSPCWCDWCLDGSPSGKGSPFPQHTVLPSAHSLELSKAHKCTWRGSLSVLAGIVCNLNIGWTYKFIVLIMAGATLKSSTIISFPQRTLRNLTKF